MNKLISKIIEECNGPYEDKDLAVVTVSGKDNKRFLQGQLTNDVINLESDKYLLSSYCTHQGKVIANIQVLVIEEKVLIILPKSIVTLFIDKISLSKKILLLSIEKFFTLMDFSLKYFLISINLFCKV